MKNKNGLLLLSGGIDSTTMLAYLISKGYKVTAISFSYNQKHSIELDFAKRNASRYGVAEHRIVNLDAELFAKSALVNPVLDLATYDPNLLPTGPVNAYIPFRNLIFLSHAFSLAETNQINEIFIAFNKNDSDNFWDCSPSFIENLNSMPTRFFTAKIQAPFINLTKKDVILLAQNLGVDLNETLSCYQPNGAKACGICLSCALIEKAMREINMGS